MTAPSWITPEGLIGTVTEGNPFTFPLNFTGSGPISINLIAGILPPALTLSNTGVISGTANLEANTTDYQFTIRISNSDGFADQTFSIDVQNIIPIWADPMDMGFWPPEAYFQYNFFVNDAGGSSQTFEKIGGILPPGLAMNSFGELYGIIAPATSETAYTFTIRALLDGTQYIDRTFTLTVDPGAPTPPVWLTPPGLLGNANQGVFASFQVIAESPDFQPVAYSAVGLPAGFSINSATGLISGTLTSNVSTVDVFTIIAQSGASAPVPRTFSINANLTSIYTVTWITSQTTPIGQIKEGDKSLLAVQAVSNGSWVRYALTGGSLPLGLSLDVNSGNIWGLAEEQLPDNSPPVTYDFQVTAYSQNAETIGNFSLQLIKAYQPGSTRVYVTLFGNDKLNFIDLFSTPEIYIGSVFQDGNPQFGFVNKPKILLVENLNAPGADLITTTLAGVRRTYIDFGKVEVGQAVVNNEVVYEVLYRRIFDDYAGAPVSYSFQPQSEAPNPPPTPITLNPGSLTNLRTRLLALGSSGGVDNLPLWMKSEQIIGNPLSVPGWVPCLEFAYIKPGLGQGFANKINANDMQLKKLYNNRIRVDRFVMENAADDPSSPSWFPAQYILFDNQF